mmetsp:Transcript_58317/g.142597  ORF Transcript_58317/g.142597 Transcript_58317/m.142597 type:complete len:92 (+) Transcript_58317:991-1266(+)
MKQIVVTYIPIAMRHLFFLRHTHTPKLLLPYYLLQCQKFLEPFVLFRLRQCDPKIPIRFKETMDQFLSLFRDFIDEDRRWNGDRFGTGTVL